MMRLFNSLSKSVETFTPVEDKKVIMYVCGITPYDSAHIGHARTYVLFDVIKRYLIKSGNSVYHIQNITDVEDKIIRRCKETGADPGRLTAEYHDEALELLSQVHVLRADVYPKVTEHMPEIISMVRALLENGAAYETATGVYFDISSFRDYGNLSGQDLEQISAGSRFEVDESKHDPADFALWKKTGGEIIEFDSPWGRGRPGWHIECSAMSKKYARRTLDIHGGGRDLIFPHHENEIAQSESESGRKFCRYWMHTGFLTVNGEKMSKSLGNFITLRNALSNSSPNALRLFYLQAHYRSPLDYDEDNLASMEESVERIFNSLGLIREAAVGEDTHIDEELRKKSGEQISLFYSRMEDDFNTPEAMAALFSLLRIANSHLEGKHDKKQLMKILRSVEDMLWILGIVEESRSLDDKSSKIFALIKELGGQPPSTAEEALSMLIQLRDSARAKKDYKASDMIRARLKEIGITIEDKSGGTRWKL